MKTKILEILKCIPHMSGLMPDVLEIAAEEIVKGLTQGLDWNSNLLTLEQTVIYIEEYTAKCEDGIPDSEYYGGAGEYSHRVAALLEIGDELRSIVAKLKALKLY